MMNDLEVFCFHQYNKSIYPVYTGRFLPPSDWSMVMHFRACCEKHTNQQFTVHRDVENSVPLHADIPCTSKRYSDLPSEAVLQEYLQFTYKYFLLVPPFTGLLL